MDSSLQIFGGEDIKKLMRIHLARLMPGSKIRIHRDHGGYTAKVGLSGHAWPVHAWMHVKSGSTKYPGPLSTCVDFFL